LIRITPETKFDIYVFINLVFITHIAEILLVWR